MAKWKELPPSPEAIVRAALERAAETSGKISVPFADTQNASVGLPTVGQQIAKSIRSLASDPAEVAAIIKNAGEQ
jgi:hypothetical protein